MQRRHLLTLLALVVIAAIAALVAAVLSPPLGPPLDVDGEAPAMAWRIVFGVAGLVSLLALFRHADRVSGAPLSSEARTLGLIACSPGVALDFRAGWPALVTLSGALVCLVIALSRRRWRRQFRSIGPKATALVFFVLFLLAAFLVPDRQGASLALLVPAVMVAVDAWKMSCVRGLRVFGVIATLASTLLGTFGWLAREGLAFDGLLVARPFVIAAVLALLALLHPRAHPEKMVGRAGTGTPGKGMPARP
jgi:hypothetical protein